MKSPKIGAVALITMATVLGLVSIPQSMAQVPDNTTVVSRSLSIAIDKTIEPGVASPPFQRQGKKYSLLQAEKITFHRGEDSHLTAKLRLSVLAWTKAEYQIVTTVLGAWGEPLCTATHRERVQYIMLGRSPMIQREIPLDFGDSPKLSRAAFFRITIREIAEPTLTGNATK
ncbi:MAG: hypothetical protein QM758_01850 [Armatimonas sp.]